MSTRPGWSAPSDPPGAGLGAAPGDVQVNGTIEVYNQCFDDPDNPEFIGCFALNNLWRGMSNLTINVNTLGQGGCESTANFWAVSQANTVVLGMGLATPDALDGAVPLRLYDRPGIVVAGATIDAGSVESPVLLQVSLRRARSRCCSRRARRRRRAARPSARCWGCCYG